MNLNQDLSLNQSQSLILTPSLKQSIDILSMSKLEVEEEIKKESEENPVIEVEINKEINWQEYIDDIDKSVKYKNTYINNEKENDLNLENLIVDECNIYEYLYNQIKLYPLNKKDLKVCEYIINSLDKDGYLRIDEKEVINLLKISKEKFDECLDKIQQLEPSGVGARNLSECLLIQIKNLKINREVLNLIIIKDLNLLANLKYKEISKKYKISLDECKKLANIIKKLEPKPGQICNIEKFEYIQPDVIVENIQDEFIIYENKKDTYNIKINNYYKEVLKNSEEDKDAKEFIKEKLNSASTLIKNIENRKSTIIKIAKEIVKTQDEFLHKGINYIKPMTMKEIAQKLNFHESTISRGVNGKYMLTPYGLFEFKYFFTSSIKNIDDDFISSTTIKKDIKEIIKLENKLKPLSDENISKILKEKGINVARRTVAKYREDMNILPSSKRKEF